MVGLLTWVILIFSIEHLITLFTQTVKCTFEKKEDDDMLRIWIEPRSELDSEPQTSEIAQLDVRVESFLDQLPVSGGRAVAGVQQECK